MNNLFILNDFPKLYFFTTCESQSRGVPLTNENSKNQNQCWGCEQFRISILYSEISKAVIKFMFRVCVFYVWLFGWGALNFSNVYLVIHFDAPHIPSNNDFVYMFVCVLPHTLLFNDYGQVSTQEFSQCLHSRINVFKCIERQMSISQHTQNLNIY